MKNYYVLALALSLLLGCNPLEERQALTKSKIDKADKAANMRVKGYKPEIRKMQSYEPYRYQTVVDDPFQTKQFLISEGVSDIADTVEPKCKPPQCVPPFPHKKSFLEKYGLDELVFVGTLNQYGNVGLIKTPDVGVVRVKKGDYIGRDNGKVLAIKETAIILQEKIYKSGVWENKKTVLMINK